MIIYFWREKQVKNLSRFFSTSSVSRYFNGDINIPTVFLKEIRLIEANQKHGQQQ
jgi:hypothetical protein